MTANDPYCPRCNKHFPAGDRTGHCGQCHETFYGLASFENHRRGAHGTNRHCILPGTDQSLDWWKDDRQRWHLGQQLTPEQTRQIWGQA
ncbi:hypothetical protein GCM10027417_23980 [Glutamicibacter endophyticus]